MGNGIHPERIGRGNLVNEHFVLFKREMEKMLPPTEILFCCLRLASPGLPFAAVYFMKSSFFDSVNVPAMRR